MPKYLARYQVLVSKELEALDLDGAARQAKAIGEGIKFIDSDGDPQHAALYSIEEIKNDPTRRDPDPFTPRPQRQFAA